MEHRLILTADWQLGMPRSFLSPEAQADFDTARLDAVGALGALAEEVQATAILVGGDVFDGHGIAARRREQALVAIKSLPVRTLLLPGNHDPLVPQGLWERPEFAERLGLAEVVRDRQPISLAPGLEVVGAPWPSKRPGGDLVAQALADLPPLPEGHHRVLLGHGGLDVLTNLHEDSGEGLQPIRQELLEQALADRRITLAVFGDRHSYTEVGHSGAIVYPGAPEPTSFRETDAGKVVVAHLGATVRLEPRAVGRWQFLEQVLDFETGEEIAALEAWLDGLDDQARRTIYKLRARGRLTPAARGRLAAFLDRARERLAAVTLRDRDLRIGGRDPNAPTPAGWLGAAIAELETQAEATDASGQVASDALVHLHRLLDDQAAEGAGA